jgi:hypothetical protein
VDLIGQTAVTCGEKQEIFPMLRDKWDMERPSIPETGATTIMMCAFTMLPALGIPEGGNSVVELVIQNLQIVCEEFARNTEASSDLRNSKSGSLADNRIATPTNIFRLVLRILYPWGRFPFIEETRKMNQFVPNSASIIVVRIIIAYLCSYVGAVAGTVYYHRGNSFASDHASQLWDPLGPIMTVAMSIITPRFYFACPALAIVILVFLVLYVIQKPIPLWTCCFIALGFAILTNILLYSWRS